MIFLHKWKKFEFFDNFKVSFECCQIFVVVQIKVRNSLTSLNILLLLLDYKNSKSWVKFLKIFKISKFLYFKL